MSNAEPGELDRALFAVPDGGRLLRPVQAKFRSGRDDSQRPDVQGGGESLRCAWADDAKSGSRVRWPGVAGKLVRQAMELRPDMGVLLLPLGRSSGACVACLSWEKAGEVIAR
jgi:hypothetical protein